VSAGWTVCVAATPNDVVDEIVEGAGLIAARIFLVVCLTRNPHTAACSHTLLGVHAPTSPCEHGSG
jgi:hypothetical protein